MQVKLAISSTGTRNQRYTLKNVRTVKYLSLNSQCLNLKRLQKYYPYLKNINGINLKKAMPTIIIDNTNLIAPIEILKDPN